MLSLPKFAKSVPCNEKRDYGSFNQVSKNTKVEGIFWLLFLVSGYFKSATLCHLVHYLLKMQLHLKINWLSPHCTCWDVILEPHIFNGTRHSCRLLSSFLKDGISALFFRSTVSWSQFVHLAFSVASLLQDSVLQRPLNPFLSVFSLKNKSCFHLLL